MAAPIPTARQTPTGIRLQDGYQSLVTFATAPAIGLWEMEVTPLGYDGGPRVDTTTMHNADVLTYAPQQLIDTTESTFKAAYDPDAFNTLLSLVNVRTTVTNRFPDGSTQAFFGFLRTFIPDPLVRGTMPTATCAVSPTNTDSSGVEQVPVLTSVAGT